MNKVLTYDRDKGVPRVIQVVNTPSYCPFCHLNIQQNPIWFNPNMHTQQEAYLMLQCSNLECSVMYSAKYSYDAGNYKCRFQEISLGISRKAKFPEIISNRFPAFVEIFNQAFSAEQNNLTEICGMGYRKALEFLIKDYIISVKSEVEGDVKTLLLGKCIDKYIDNSKIKEISKRAVWLGNDETHYVRKWIDKDITDLKKLIQITVYYIKFEITSNQYIEEMPS